MACSERVAIAEIAKTRDDAELGGVPFGPSLRTQPAVRVAVLRHRESAWQERTGRGGPLLVVEVHVRVARALGDFDLHVALEETAVT